MVLFHSIKSSEKALLFVFSSIVLLAISPIIYPMQSASAETGDLLLTMNDTTPSGDNFGSPVASTINGDILVGATSAGSAYLFEGFSGPAPFCGQEQSFYDEIIIGTDNS